MFKELQQLADQEDSDGESSEDDWKKEGRKISEDLAKGFQFVWLLFYKLFYRSCK